METKTLPIGFELKAVSGRTIEGYAAAWAKDRVNDIISPKAFDRTVKENPDVAVFIGHDASRLPVGEATEMRPDHHGLFTRTQVYDTPDGNALLEVAKSRLAKGRTLGMSIGFRTVRDHWDAKQKARILEDVDLIEYSFLASPALAANPLAVALGVKSVDGTVEPVPDELQEEVKALVEEYVANPESKPYRIVSRDGEFCVVGGASGNSTLGCHLSRAQALNHMRALYANVPDASGKATQGMSASSYAWVDSSGTGHLDISDEGHVRAAMARFNQTHFSDPAAKRSAARKIVARARSYGMDVADDSAVAQAAKGAPSMDLEDTAFAFIEPGGMLDEERKTVPRANRYFAHHLGDGSVDIESLKACLADPDLFAHGDLPVAHLLRHAQAAGVWGRTIPHDDAHEEQWTKGAAPMLLVREYKAGLLAEAAAADFLAHEQLGHDTKDGMRVSQKLQAQIVTEQEAWTTFVTKARELEQGIDGVAVVDTWRTAFQLLDLEEVA